MTADFSPAVEQLWRRFQPLAQSRVAELDAYAGVRAEGRDDEDARARARAAAHALAGALGSYGRPEGSALAAEVEALLTLPGAEPGRLGELSDRLAAVVRR